MSTDTSVVDPARLDAFPAWLNGLSDPQWLREIAGLIAGDLPHLSEDDKQCVYQDMVEARMCAFRARFGADA